MKKKGIEYKGSKGETKTLTYEEWTAEAKRLYGPKSRHWRFKCVQCGHVQTMGDFVDAGMSVEEAQSRGYFSCIGRWVEDVGCDWTLGGLFNFAKVMVIPEDGGKPIPVFEFADTEPNLIAKPVLEEDAS